MGKFSGENLVALICCVIVIYMIVGGGYTFIKNLITDTKLTLIIFISVPIVLGIYTLYNYFRYFK